MSKPYSLKKHIYNSVIRMKSVFYKLNKDAIFIFGNQKSGTTAIAALLAQLSGKSVTLDILTLNADEQDELFQGKLDFERFAKKHKYEFSKEIIKEATLTFLFDDLSKIFNLQQCVFIIRDPRHNIRSILNRLNLRGDLAELKEFKNLPPLWQRIVDNRWLGVPHEHYIDSLAGRWNLAADIYFQNKNSFILLRYEDFLKDKIASIRELAQYLKLPRQNDISHFIDFNFQPPGNKGVTMANFFGDNLERIERACYDNMKKFGYE